MDKQSVIIGVLFLTVAVSGCVDQNKLPDQVSDKATEAQLIGEVTDQRITEDSPGELTLNARNLKNETTTFYVDVQPVGDYRKLARVTDREGEDNHVFDLGEAVEGATTGEKFAMIRKKANVTANVKVKAKLYTQDLDEVLDTETYKLKMSEE